MKTYTVHGTVALAEDNLVIDAPGLWKNVKIVSGSLTLDTPGTDVVVATIKTGVTATKTDLYEVSLNTALGTVEQLPVLVGGVNENIYIELSDAVNVNYTLTFEVEDGM